uniref:Uncharacterized protein n=1 Tax=Cacopsylla melanoneura TaxID=428564 RepID=A0A8D8YQK0_9HEMI
MIGAPCGTQPTRRLPDFKPTRKFQMLTKARLRLPRLRAKSSSVPIVSASTATRRICERTSANVTRASVRRVLTVRARSHATTRCVGILRVNTRTNSISRPKHTS